MRPKKLQGSNYTTAVQSMYPRLQPVPGTSAPDLETFPPPSQQMVADINVLPTLAYLMGALLMSSVVNLNPHGRLQKWSEHVVDNVNPIISCWAIGGVVVNKSFVDDWADIQKTPVTHIALRISTGPLLRSLASGFPISERLIWRCGKKHR